MPNGPLAGVTILELAGIGPAPCAGMMLADMGADVIVVERPSSSQNEAYRHAIYNRGKRSICLDLKDPESVVTVKQLLTQSDALIEGFRPGVMERLGLGPDVCFEINPALVYGRMTGWGQSGPLSQAAGHDPNYVAISGVASVAAAPGSPPRTPITVAGDLGGGTMVLLFGLMSALFSARETGVGQVIDSAITDGTAYLSTLLHAMYNTGQLSDEPGSGWCNFGAPWNEVYECADGRYVNVCALEKKFYDLLIDKLGLEWDPLFSEQWDVALWEPAKERLKHLFLSRTQSEWCALLEGTDVCFAPVLSLQEAMQHPHNTYRKTFLEIDGVSQPAPAPRLSVTPASAGSVPRPGQHTLEILKNISASQ